jgi:hypothetical protein
MSVRPDGEYAEIGQLLVRNQGKLGHRGRFSVPGCQLGLGEPAQLAAEVFLFAGESADSTTALACGCPDAIVGSDLA